MNELKFTTGGLMALVALFAVDFALVPGITRVPNSLTRIGLFGALPMVHVLAFYLVLLGARLRRQGEIGLPSGVFLLVGGALVLVLGLISSVAPQVLYLYVDNTAGLWTSRGQTVSDIYLFGMNRIDPLLALLVFATITPLLVIPALLAGGAARGYRLRLEKSAHRGGTRLRITVSGLMIIIAVIAVDLAVLLLARGTGNRAILGVIPMADVLAVLLATTARRLRRRGEVPLSHVVFLLAGGMALVLIIYLFHLRPELFYEYVLNTAGRWGVGNPLVRVLLFWLALSVPILVPALIGGWARRGYRLRLTTCIDGP